MKDQIDRFPTSPITTPDGFTAIVEQNYPLIINFLKTKCSPDDVQDLTQQTFLLAWKNAHTYDSSQASINRWLLSIASHCRINAFRHQRRHFPQDISLDELLEDSPGFIDHQPRHYQETDFAISREQTGLIINAINTLPLPQRQVIFAAYFAEMTQSQIAASTNTPLGTVKTRLGAAYQRLRLILTAELDRPMKLTSQ